MLLIFFPQEQTQGVLSLVASQEGWLELVNGEAIPAFLEEVGTVQGAVKTAREGKARRVAAEALGERVKAQAMQATPQPPKKARADQEADEDPQRGEDQATGENGGRKGNDGADEEDEGEDELGVESAVPAKRKRTTEVSGRLRRRVELTRPTGGRGQG